MAGRPVKLIVPYAVGQGTDIAARYIAEEMGKATSRSAKTRSASMPYPRVVPHSDGAGAIGEVGDGVPAERIDQRVWCFGVQSYRPFGTAAWSRCRWIYARESNSKGWGRRAPAPLGSPRTLEFNLKKIQGWGETPACACDEGSRLGLYPSLRETAAGGL